MQPLVTSMDAGRSGRTGAHMYVHGTWHRLLMLMLIDADDAAADIDVDAGVDVDTYWCRC